MKIKSVSFECWHIEVLCSCSWRIDNLNFNVEMAVKRMPDPFLFLLNKSGLLENSGLKKGVSITS